MKQIDEERRGLVKKRDKHNCCTVAEQLGAD